MRLYCSGSQNFWLTFSLYSSHITNNIAYFFPKVQQNVRRIFPDLSLDEGEQLQSTFYIFFFSSLLKAIFLFIKRNFEVEVSSRLIPFFPPSFQTNILIWPICVLITLKNRKSMSLHAPCLQWFIKVDFYLKTLKFWVECSESRKVYFCVGVVS